MSDRLKLAAFYNSQGFPKITADNLQVTSPCDPNYNCIAWAADENFRWWWPDAMEQAYWPSEAPREVTKEAFVKAYSTLGYDVCDGSKVEAGYEKIVIYCRKGVPTHAARLIADETWTSKLGEAHDMSHSIDQLDGPAYGEPHIYMKRKRK